MQQKDSSHTRTLHFFGFIILSVALITADHRNNIPDIRKALNIVTYPLKVLVDLPYDTTYTLMHFFTSHKKLSNENKKLRQLLSIYSARDQKYRSIAAENQRFRGLLNTAQKYDEAFLLADILTVDSDRFHQTVTINKGTNDQAFEGQIALAGNSIYGQVINTSPHSSIVMQITDPKHTIPVRNARTNEKALAIGTGKTNTVNLEHIEDLDDVRTGDLYVSSGLGLLFPADFPVAVVQKKHYNPADSLTTVTAKTVTDFKRTRELLLIWQAKKASEQPQKQKKKPSQ